MKIIDAFKMAWVGFAEEMKWSYNVRLSYGPSFARSKMKMFYKKPKWYQWRKRREYRRLLRTK